jgi:tetratricopeptide (TPR) repeat protein
MVCKEQIFLNLTQNKQAMKKAIFTLLIMMMSVIIPSSVLFAQEDDSMDDGKVVKDRYGEDSVSCVMNISLYREFFKQWKASNYQNETIKDAITPWRWVLLNCPKGTQNTYIDGVKIMQYQIENAKDPALKDKYIDTLMMVHDQRIEYFGKEGYVLGRKGVDLMNYRPKDYDKAYEIFKRSVELEGNKSAGPVIVFYFQSAISMVKDGKADTAVIFDTYDIISNIIDYNLNKYKDNAKEKGNWEIVQGNVELRLEPFATCKDIISIYRVKFEQKPDDIDLLRKISTLLDKKGCQEDRLYYDVTKRLYQLDPTPQSAYMIGKMLLKEEKYAESIDYFKEVDKSGDTVMTQKAYKYIADAYRSINNYPSSRTYALKAAALDPTDGEPYILIGDLYASSALDCGDNDLTKHITYWVAVDKYYKAKQVDPDIADVADKRIASYSEYFPAAQTIFFYHLNEGDTYTVECWINETTKVRAAK